MEKTLRQLVEKLQHTFGERLASVVLYGSGATGDVHPKFSDLNVLCILKTVTPRELAESEPIFRWWRSFDSPAPLLLSEDEVRTSTDCFAVEFRDIQARSRLLAGRDVVSELEIDFSFYRAQVEYELRGKLLRLRQKAAGVLSDKELLLRLMADSVSTFCTLGRHALLLAGREAKWQKREIVNSLELEFGIPAAPFLTLLDLREGVRKPRQVGARDLLVEYLAAILKLVATVDRLER
jgi:predicted nucleotidyltransferase